MTTTTLPTAATAARRWPLWIAAAVLAATAAIHVLAGTGDYLAAVDRAGLVGEARGLAIALWHLTSVMLILLPVGLWWAGRQHAAVGRPIIAAAWLICLAFVAVMLGVDLAAGGLVEPLVQWTLFVPALALLPLTRLPADGQAERG